MANKQKIKTLNAPRQLLLYYSPLTEITDKKKYKLNIPYRCYTFILSKTQPDIIFLQTQEHTIRINKILKTFTNTEGIKEQFIKLLDNPIIIYNKAFTVLIIEIIYMFSFLFNIDLNKYIRYNNLNPLIKYYFKNITL